MSNECSRCGTATESPYVTVTGGVSFDGWLCDECREEFEEWVAAKREKPPVRGGCGSCGGPVEVAFNYTGGGKVDLRANCTECGWTGKMEGDY